MKRTVDIVVISLAGLTLTAAVAVGIFGFRHNYAKVKCSSIKVEVADSASNKFLTGSSIMDRIDRDFGGYVNIPLTDIDLYRVEEVVMKEPFVRKAVVYTTRDGILHVKVKQCTPVGKIMSDDILRYVDELGECFKVENDWCEDIPIVKGGAPVNDTVWTKDLSGMLQYVSGNERFKDSISRIESDVNGEITLMLKDRDELFIMGRPSSIADKFGMIEQYMDKVSPVSGKKYRSVNVKYSGQIICRE